MKKSTLDNSREPIFANQEYFADGMTKELITNLASIRSLRVISRAYVMRFKSARKPVPEIARELNVDGIIEGTMARSGSHIRITANLLHAPTDRHLWANSYETEMEDVLVTQSKVAHSIADALLVELAPQNALLFQVGERLGLTSLFENALAFVPLWVIAITGECDKHRQRSRDLIRCRPSPV